MIDQRVAVARPSAMSQSGPIFLLGALTLLIFKSAPFFWPLFAAAFVGLIVSRLWQTRGFYFSLAILATISIFMLRKGIDPLWTTLLAISISISWFLVIMGRREMQSFMQSQEEKVRVVEEEKRSLQQQIQKESRQLEKEREKLKRDLQEALAKILLLQNEKQVVPAVIPQVEVSDEEKLLASQVQHQYDLLREQFEEKSDALDQARKELFRVENELLALQKATTEMSLDDSEENRSLARDLKALEDERSELEAQVAYLQEVVSALLTPKKRAARSKKEEDPLDFK